MENRELEFDLQETDLLPRDGEHTFFFTRENRGKIYHSKEATEAELTVARGMLQRGHATDQELSDYHLSRAARDRS